MEPQIVTLIAAVIAAVVSILTLILNSKFTFKRERKLVAWRKEIERFLELEELAGELVEELGSYKNIGDRDKLGSQMERLSVAAGRFARYAPVRQAIRDLHNTLARTYSAKRDHEDEREIRRELDASYQTFLSACDSVIGNRLR